MSTDDLYVSSLIASLPSLWAHMTQLLDLQVPISPLQINTVKNKILHDHTTLLVSTQNQRTDLTKGEKPESGSNIGKPKGEH